MTPLCSANNRFSINFVNDTCRDPQNITYHFKWILHEDIIVENYKQNGDWIDHRETSYDAFDGRFSNSLQTLDSNPNDSNYASSNNGFKSAKHNKTDNAFINPYSILGPTFALEFAFQDDSIYVYLVHDDDGRNIVTQYEPEFEMSDIESIQIWGDIQKVNELTFSYN